MDYTPGALVNMDKANFTPNFTRPESQGTRAHQVALYVNLWESFADAVRQSFKLYEKNRKQHDL